MGVSRLDLLGLFPFFQNFLIYIFINRPYLARTEAANRSCYYRARTEADTTKLV